jgi:hypothetical protein
MADREPKAKGIPPKPEKAALEKAQHERFVAEARAAGVGDELSESFDRVAEKIATAKKPHK